MLPFAIMYFLMINVLIVHKMLFLIDVWLLLGYAIAFFLGLAILLRSKYEHILGLLLGFIFYMYVFFFRMSVKSL